MTEKGSAKRKKDIWKEALLYNTTIRLKSRQAKIRKRDKLPFEKKNLVYLGIVIIFLILVYIFLVRFVKYDPSRYISVFSATIQGVSTIFALVAAGTLLLVERIGSRSPRSLSFLPSVWSTGLFLIFVIVISSDILVLLVLGSLPTLAHLVNAVLVLNIATIVVTVFYIKSLLTWLHPKTVFQILQKKGEKAKSEKEALEIVNAVREFAIGSILNHDSLGAKSALEVCWSLSEAFCKRWKGKSYAVRRNPNHPIRQIAKCATEIGLESIKIGMLELGDVAVSAICSMASHMHENQIPIDVWIFGNIQKVTEALIEKKHGIGCISELIVEAKVAADLDKLSLAYWLVCCFDDLARKTKTYNDLESARTLALGVEIMAEVFSKKATGIYATTVLSETLKLLKSFSKEETFGSYRGRRHERTIREILKDTKTLLVIATQKAFFPKEAEGWPIPHF